VSATARLDANAVTGFAFSPRVATLIRPAPGHFLRLMFAKAFRKPAFIEYGAHPTVDFPPNTPLKGSEAEFMDFLTRVLGNPDVDNENISSFELGYLGRYLEGTLVVSLDLYFNWLTDVIQLDTHLVPDPLRVINLARSYVWFDNVGPELGIFGGELALRFNPTDSLMVQASWAHREVVFLQTGRGDDTSPKNMLTLGGRYLGDDGLLGSLYLFTRSEFWDRAVENPEGLFSPLLEVHMDDLLLLVARLGQRFTTDAGLEMEIGCKLFWPFALGGGPVREKGGVITGSGKSWGGFELGRVLAAYLQLTY